MQIYVPTMSPSCITYCFPSCRYFPASFTFAILAAPSWRALKSLKAHTSALIKPLSKSVWITPAAWGAAVPCMMVHALTSFGPAVKYDCKHKAWRPDRIKRGTIDLTSACGPLSPALRACSLHSARKAGSEFVMFQSERYHGLVRLVLKLVKLSAGELL